MKRTTFILFLGFICGTMTAQDIIFKIDGEEISAKIIEITTDAVKYKLYDFQEGPLRSISKSNVFLIIYENGKRESFGNVDTPRPREEETVSITTQDGYRGSFISVSIGYGRSYGGLGTRIEGRIGSNVGVGFHGGLGFYYNEEFWFDEGPRWGVGVKFFPYRGIFIGTQFGFFDYKRYRDYDYYYDYDYDYYYTTDFGPTFMAGIDWAWGDKVGFGIDVGAGFSYAIDYGELVFAWETGFVIRF